MRCLFLFGFCILTAAAAAFSQAGEADTEAASQGNQVGLPAPERGERGEHGERGSHRLRGRVLALDINARVIEQNQTVTWTESHQVNTLPGRPVGLKLVGTNVVVVVQFTPYIRQRGAQKFLVAQGQIWMDIPGQGIRYHTSMQTIPLEFGEPIYFFPLGPQTDEDAACIEVMLTLYPYEEN